MNYKFLLSIGIVGLTTFTSAPSKHEFTFKLEKGKIYQQTTNVESETIQTVQGTQMSTKNSVSANTYMELKDEGDTTNIYDVWYGGISMKIEGMGMNQSFSSDTTELESVDAVSRILSSLIDQKFQATINLSGRVNYVDNLENIIENAVGNESSQTDMMKDQIMASFGDGGFAKNIEMSTNIVPDKPVKIGDTWQVQQYTNTGLPLIIVNNYTLKSVNDGIATISIDGSLSVDPKNAKTSIQGLDAVYFMDGSRTGELNLEIETGWLVDADFKDDIVGSISISPSAQVPNGMTVPLEMKNNTTITTAK